MKEDITDKQLRDLLKESAKDTPENEWFVRKVMNRLPERRKTHNWILWGIYIIVASICCIGWGMFMATADPSKFFNDITSSNTLPQTIHLLALIAVTTVVIWQMISTQLHSDHP